MVFILDEGSEFDAPIDVVWKYLQSERHQHPTMKMISREVKENSVVITSDRPLMGKMVRMKVKNSVHPPIGVLQDHLEGPTAGSKAFLYYIPHGDKTGVTVVGDYHVDGLNEQQTKEAILAQLQTSFDEDNEILKKTK